MSEPAVLAFKVQLTVALVVRKRASWLMLETSGELFIISLTREIGSEIVFLLADVWSSLSELFWAIFVGTRHETSGIRSCFELWRSVHPLLRLHCNYSVCDLHKGLPPPAGRRPLQSKTSTRLFSTTMLVNKCIVGFRILSSLFSSSFKVPSPLLLAST